MIEYLAAFIAGFFLARIINRKVIGKTRWFRLFNRLYRYIYVPLFRKKWTKFDRYFYDKWEKVKG